MYQDQVGLNSKDAKMLQHLQTNQCGLLHLQKDKNRIITTDAKIAHNEIQHPFMIKL